MDIEKQPPEQDNPQAAEEKTTGQPGWFQDFVDHYDVDKPQQGEMLQGRILDIQEGSILLDVGLKRDAIIPKQDLDRVDPEYLNELAVGDEIVVGVMRTPLGDDDLLVSLQQGLTQKTWAKAEELAESSQVIELKIVDQNRGGLLVSFDNLQGFVPNSHIPAIRRGTSSQKAGEIKAGLVGKDLPLKVIEANSKERKLVFSARVAQREQRLKRLEEIQIGQVINSRVANVVDFGLFVDLEGVDGLIHKSEIDWGRVAHPGKLFQVGDEIEVKVVSVDIENERVSLSRKALLPNPWEKLVAGFKAGDLVQGVVVSVLEFGAFVEIAEGLQGLVHVSEIGYSNSGDHKAVLKKGDPVLVKIMGIDTGRERVSLSMRRVPVSDQMEWIMNLEDVSEALALESNTGEELIEDHEQGGHEGDKTKSDQEKRIPGEEQELGSAEELLDGESSSESENEELAAAAKTEDEG